MIQSLNTELIAARSENLQLSSEIVRLQTLLDERDGRDLMAETLEITKRNLEAKVSELAELVNSLNVGKREKRRSSGSLDPLYHPAIKWAITKWYVFV